MVLFVWIAENDIYRFNQWYWNHVTQRWSKKYLYTVALKPCVYMYLYTRWFKYDRDKLWLVYTQIVPVIFEPPCIWADWEGLYLPCQTMWVSSNHLTNNGNRTSLQNFVFSYCLLKQWMMGKVQNLDSLMYDISLSALYRMGIGYFEFLQKRA
jgi:hypothetical protein